MTGLNYLIINRRKASLKTYLIIGAVLPPTASIGELGLFDDYSPYLTQRLLL